MDGQVVLRDLPGMTVGAVWVGSRVAGWRWVCSQSLAPRCAPAHLFPSDREAWEAAADHWNVHEQER